MEDITKEKLVNILDKYLFGWEYGDIERASIHSDAKLAGFILGACFIDAMAGFFAGVKKEEIRKGSSKRFICFTKKYLPRYSADNLWEDLRCGLVHSYALGGTYVFTDARKDGFHFNTTAKGKIILNLEDFLSDLRSAYNKLRNDILTDNDVFLKAKDRYLSIGIIRKIKIENT